MAADQAQAHCAMGSGSGSAVRVRGVLRRLRSPQAAAPRPGVGVRGCSRGPPSCLRARAMTDMCPAPSKPGSLAQTVTYPTCVPASQGTGPLKPPKLLGNQSHLACCLYSVGGIGYSFPLCSVCMLFPRFSLSEAHLAPAPSPHPLTCNPTCSPLMPFPVFTLEVRHILPLHPASPLLPSHPPPPLLPLPSPPLPSSPPFQSSPVQLPLPSAPAPAPAPSAAFTTGFVLRTAGGSGFNHFFPGMLSRGIHGGSGQPPLGLTSTRWTGATPAWSETPWTKAPAVRSRLLLCPHAAYPLLQSEQESLSIDKYS